MNANLKEKETQRKITSAVEDSIGNPTKGGEISTTHTEILNIVLTMIEEGKIGFRTLLRRFSDAGMSDVAQSWVGTHANAEVDERDVELALGDDQIEAIAKEAGIPASEVTE